MQPVDIRNIGETEVLFTWDDGHRSLYSYEFLRLNCPCAGCRDEWTGRRLIKLSDIRKDIKPLQSMPVGRYALKYAWNDHHDTGIYGFDFLRQICPCGACASKGNS